ncbi:hypothetical protein [Rhodococcus qingshengii]|uniref:hypothetical protein n=1 Tax=Rhodococcus qingshengii TaxID=334542 RepID=UPI00211E5B08|nr:hypothetical protein [Rhodococcus qingshengii]
MSPEAQQDVVDGITSNQPALNREIEPRRSWVLVFGQQIDRVVKTHLGPRHSLRRTRDRHTRRHRPSLFPHRSTNHSDISPENETSGTPPPTQVRGWVFRGYIPGQHINPGHLRNRLKSTFGTRAARLGTLHELTKLAPAAILADTLGYSPATIERHAVASAGHICPIRSDD